MIQFNLLPDVKIDYIKARRAKRMVLVMSTLVSGSVLTIMILLFVVVNVFQKTHLNDLKKDINHDSTTLQSTPDLNKILTVQNQLQTLPGLHNKKPVVSRLFGYITQTTPTNITIAKYDIDFNTHTIGIEGTGSALENVNTFVDTLKFTTFINQNDSQPQAKKAFSNIVLASFSRNDKGANYHLDLLFDPSIFDVSQSIVLTVPKTTTTRSETQKPSDLFKQTPPTAPSR